MRPLSGTPLEPTERPAFLSKHWFFLTIAPTFLRQCCLCPWCCPIFYWYYPIYLFPQTLSIQFDIFFFLFIIDHRPVVKFPIFWSGKIPRMLLNHNCLLIVLFYVFHPTCLDSLLGTRARWSCIWNGVLGPQVWSSPVSPIAFACKNLSFSAHSIANVGFGSY